MFPSYRNQSVDLQSKSADWFLYDGNIELGKWGYDDLQSKSTDWFLLYDGNIGR